MCGRITLLTYDELREVAEAVKSGRGTMGGPLDDCEERLQARPGGAVQALVLGADAASEHAPGAPASANLPSNLEVASLSWGFETPWNKGLAFNTRIESALEGARMWAEPIREGRCILPVATFFEPHESETQRNSRTGRTTKRQYEFASPVGEPLLLASVQREGRLSVVTTEPNAAVAPIHKRMPLALRFEEVPVWLGGDYAILADRTDFDLLAYPENSENDEDDPVQLSLF